QANGFFLAAEEGELVGSTEKSHKTSFHIDQHDGGKKVSLKTHNGHYVAVNNQRQIYISHTHEIDEAKFFLEQHPGEKVALAAHHGGYLGIDHEGRVGISHNLGQSELFEEHKA
ncbi:hypothetical protein PROFUN_14799, partial [Planoprotostelium fungivorum]